MKICFFGSYDRNYSKNTILIKGLAKKNVEVVHCFHPNYCTLFHYPSLFWQFIKNGRDCDLIFVAFYGHYDVWFAWIISKLFGKKVVFDPLVSIYNTRVEDRKYFPEGSLRAKLYFLFDKINCLLVDRVLIDSFEHLKYYQRKLGVLRKKLSVVRLGADEEVVSPKRQGINKNIKILWYGSYQPSQGALEIVKTAMVLEKESLEWILIGDGQQRGEVERFAKQEKLDKVKFLPFMPFEELISNIDKSDIVFGVFGNTIKTRMVIHNKIYHAIAMGKTLLTQNTPAVREILKDGENVLLVEPNTEDISRMLKSLLRNPKKIQIIGRNARQIFLKKFTSKQITKRLLKVFGETLAN